MCGPALPLIGLALSIGSSVMAYQGQQKQAKAQNQMRQDNAINANIAAQRKYEDEGRKLTFDARQLQQDGYKAVMDTRKAQGTALASAGASGMDISSLSVSAILADQEQQLANSLSNVQTKLTDTKDAYNSRVSSYEAEAAGRANSIAPASGPSPLALGLNIASSGFDTANKNKWI